MFKYLATPLVILASCCAGSAFAQNSNQDLINYRAGNNTVQPPVVVDARGKVAGLYNPDSNSVILNINGVPIVASVTAQISPIVPYGDQGEQSGSLYKWTSAQTTYYTSQDCSGPPIPFASRGLRPVAYVQDSNTGAVTAYIGGAGKSKFFRVLSSKLASVGAGPLALCRTEAQPRGGIQGFDVEQTVNITQLYPESLSVR